MTDMPQMIALYNGMGGGAAAAIAAVELYRGEQQTSTPDATLAVVGGIIGAVSFSGSLIAFGKLQGLIKHIAALRRPADAESADPRGRAGARRTDRRRLQRHAPAWSPACSPPRWCSACR